VSATAGNKTYDGNRNASVTLSDNRVSGDVLTLTNTSALFDTKNAGTGKTVTVSGIGISGTDVGNYHLLNTSTTATANISKRDLTVSATASNKTYDGNANASVTLSDNRVSGDVLTVSDASATFDNKNVGTGKTVTVSGIGISGTEALNYNLLNTSATNTANITQLDTVTWIGTSPGSGNWLTPGNWAGGAVPDGANVAKVVIGAGVNVTFDSGSTQLTQLTSASNITLNGGNLTLGLLRSDASLVNGGATLTVNGGALNVNGSLQADVLRLTTGSVGGTGNLTSPNFAMSGATLSGTLANLTLGSVGNFSISSPLAATQSLSLTSNGGAILDALPTGTSASLTAPVVNLTAATGIGAAAQPLRLATNDITANTTGGDIRLNNTPAPGRVLLRAAVTGNASPVIYMQNGQALQITGRLRSEGGAIIIDPPTTLSMDPTSSIVTPGGSITLESSSDMLLAALSTGSTGSINLNSSGGTIGTATPGVNNITTGSLTVAANGDVQLAYVADTVDSTGVRGRLSTPDGALPALTSDVPPVKDSLPDTTPASTTPIAAAPPDPGSTSTVAGATLTVGGTTLRKTLDELVKTDKTKGSALICR